MLCSSVQMRKDIVHASIAARIGRLTLKGESWEEC